jgi:hypothetical protein
VPHQKDADSPSYLFPPVSSALLSTRNFLIFKGEKMNMREQERSGNNGRFRYKTYERICANTYEEEKSDEII